MKKLLFILLICMACHDDSPDSEQMGCMTGLDKTTHQRGFIRCCTHKQFLAGSNVAEGGSDHVKAFTVWEWTATSDCSKCQ